MDFELQKPQMTQSQKLTMTYLMARSLKILRLTNLELKEYIDSETEKNPILEITTTFKNYINKKEAPSLHSLKYFPTLFEYLSIQAKEHFQNKTDLFIAENIIGNLDNRGYFMLNMEAFAADLKIEKNKILEVLKIVKTFEPKGIAAASAQERILLQIENDKSIEYKIIKEYFPEILKNKIEKIGKKLNAEASNIQSILETIIKKTNFDPTVNFLPKEPIDVCPDVIINKIGKKWVVEIEEDLPFFKINQSYVNLLENKKTGSSKKYVLDARILMKNILVRRKALQDICSYIIQKQKSFILGKGCLNPLTIKEIADFLKLHASTVCRAVTNKYIQCPLGLIPIKTFFSNPSKTKQNLKHFESVLKEILSEENKSKPFSDIKLVGKLRQKGFNLHRRTICKYRKKLNVGTSRQRKKYVQTLC